MNRVPDGPTGAGTALAAILGLALLASTGHPPLRAADGRGGEPRAAPSEEPARPAGEAPGRPPAAPARDPEAGVLPPPNIVIILVDDMGLGDASAYQDWTGNENIDQLDTPSIDRLARMGLRFTDMHSPASVCSPTRYGLLMGRYAWRTRLKHKVIFAPWAPPLIEKEDRTLPALLKEAGYVTAFAGKWHLGLTYQRPQGGPATEFMEADLRKPLLDGPTDHGFDLAFFTSRSHGESSQQGWFEGGRAIQAVPTAPLDVSGYDQSRVGVTGFKWVKRFVDGHISGKSSRKPFFLYYATHSNHMPYTPSPAVNGVPVISQSHYRAFRPRGRREDFIYESDVITGQLMKVLERREDPRRPGHTLAENTLFIFTSDNGSDKGGTASTGGLRGGKATIWEGGHRIPFIASWPAGGIGDGDEATPGKSTDAMFGLNDIYATLAELAGVEASRGGRGGQDSESFLRELKAPGSTRGRARPLVLHDDYVIGPAMAIRKGPWKLVVDRELIERGRLNPIALFNLDENLTEDESKNLLSDPAQKERVRELSRELKAIYHAPTPGSGG